MIENFESLGNEIDSDEKGEKIPSNYALLFYDNPVYSSNAVYGVENNLEEPAINEKNSAENRDAADEPIESWGWVNNLDRHR